MPIYEYECQNKDCGHRFEKIQAYGEEPVTTCPKCEGIVVRVISSPSFNFKGGKPSGETRMQRVGNREVPVHQTEEGHWEQDRIR